MKHFYTYRAVYGEDIQMEFEGSCTPISSIDGVPEDLSGFIQQSFDDIDQQIVELKSVRKSLLDEYLMRKKVKTIVGRKLSA